MCNPASFILTKDRIFWSLFTDSHEDIIEEFGLTDFGSRGATLARVEITPPEENRFDAPPEQWIFKLDQDLLPEWYDATEAEKRVRQALPEWLRARVVLEGHREVRKGHVYLAGSSSATLYDRSTATLYDSSTATLHDSSTATLNDSSTATLNDSSTATLHDSSTATLHDSSTATLNDSSTATLWSRSTATLCHSSTATLLGSSTATLCDSSTATLWDRSTATLNNRSSATLYGSSTATMCTGNPRVSLFPGSYAVLVDRRGHFPVLRAANRK